MKINEEIEEYLEKQNDCVSNIRKNQIHVVEEIFNCLIKCRESENRIFLIGNGGSASTASHFTSDLLKTAITKNTKRFKAYSLTDNMPVVLAWANDSSYDEVFKNQLESQIEENDVLITLSGSGNSTNVIKANEYANEVSAHTIAFTGKDGGKLAKIAKISLVIPSDDMLTIESMHLLICHLLITMIRKQGKPMFTY